jgi:lipid II:glycine glycyltransferase (peptidoglycan interpeptide bridge formation enzyme)
MRYNVYMGSQDEWNQHVQHPLQSWEWGEFRKKTGLTVVRRAGIQVTIHPIPHTPWTIGYAPKIATLDLELCDTLREIAHEYRCIFIKCEPGIEISSHKFSNSQMSKWGFVPGRPLFTKYNFLLDVRPSESELLLAMKQKTRYNIRVAEKKGVHVTLDSSERAFARFLELTQETTERQKFYAHSPKYFTTLWNTLGKHQAPSTTLQTNELTAHLITAMYEGEIITTWMLFSFKDTLYYPYGASTRAHREVMANNLVMWEVIRLAKKWGLSYLDMWGALGPEADVNDPWYGFHTFKAGYGPRHVTYIGTYDYVARPVLYAFYKIADTWRWALLRAWKAWH